MLPVFLHLFLSFLFAGSLIDTQNFVLPFWLCIVGDAVSRASIHVFYQTLFIIIIMLYKFLF